MDYNRPPCVSQVGPGGLTSGGAFGRGGNKGKRGECKGWSLGAINNMSRFMYSVIPGELSGNGFALSLTLRNCPATSADFKIVRDCLLRYFQKAGALRWHWLTEFTLRCLPHLHGVVFFPEHKIITPKAIVARWCDITKEYETRPVAQMVQPISDIQGWFGYLTEHGSRSVKHYQKEGMPDGWEKTGRLWGRSYRDTWPLKMEKKRGGWGKHWTVRRFVRSALLSEARSWLPTMDGGAPVNKNGLIAASFAALDNGGMVRVRWRNGFKGGEWHSVGWLRCMALSLYCRRPLSKDSSGNLFYNGTQNNLLWRRENFGKELPQIQLLLRFQKNRHGVSFVRRMLRCSNVFTSFWRPVRFASQSAPAVERAADIVAPVKYPDGGELSLSRIKEKIAIEKLLNPKGDKNG